MNTIILNLYNQGKSLDYISLAVNKPINELINIIYDIKIGRKNANKIFK